MATPLSWNGNGYTTSYGMTLNPNLTIKSYGSLPSLNSSPASSTTNTSSSSTTGNTGSSNGSPVSSIAARAAADLLSQLASQLFGGADSELGGALGNIFSTGISTGVQTMADNVIKGNALTYGLGKNVGSALSGTAAGLVGNAVGQGIESLGGHSRLSKGIGAGVSTGIGTVGGQVLSNYFGGNGLSVGSINPVNLGMSVAGAALGAALGPSKEFAGDHGDITKGFDLAHNIISTGASFFGPVGQTISAALQLSKGAANLFGSTDGMCVCAGTKVFTKDGEIVNIEDLIQKQGIIGWNPDNHEIRPQTIKGFIEPRLKECLEIELKNGTVLRCSVDHPILSNIKEKAETHRINGKRIAYREWIFRRADELKVGNWVGLANNIDYWGKDEMLNAYLVGMLIGDGTYTYENSCRLWTADPSTWEYLENNNLAVLIKQYTPENSNGKYSIENRDYRIINGMQLMKDLGIAYQAGLNKSFPENLGKYNKNSICKMIAGLYDTDGSFSINEEKNSYKITFYQSNLNLLEDLKLLLLKLGIFGTIYKRKSSINKMSNGRIINSNLSYKLELTDRNSVINFYKNIPINISYKKENLERIYNHVLKKQDKDHCDLSGAKLYKIVSIKSIGVQTVYNLEAIEDHTYIANGIITHNTKTDATLAGIGEFIAPVKWANTIGKKTTNSIGNESWQKQEARNSFLGGSYGDIGDLIAKGMKKSGKTYGTFSRSQFRNALKDIAFADRAKSMVEELAKQNEIQDIRSSAMASVNNQRYLLNIQGGPRFSYLGKQGMKILSLACRDLD